MGKYIYSQHKLRDQDKAKNLETGLFPYEESSDIKANCDILMTRISCKRFPCIGSAKDHKVNVILSANNTNSIK